jgi:hypothetical protein
MFVLTRNIKGKGGVASTQLPDAYTYTTECYVGICVVRVNTDTCEEAAICMCVPLSWSPLV